MNLLQLISRKNIELNWQTLVDNSRRYLSVEICANRVSMNNAIIIPTDLVFY